MIHVDQYVPEEHFTSLERARLARLRWFYTKVLQKGYIIEEITNTKRNHYTIKLIAYKNDDEASYIFLEPAHKECIIAKRIGQ